MTDEVEPQRSLAVLVLIDLARHDHDPDEEDGADDPESEGGIPALAC